MKWNKLIAMVLATVMSVVACCSASADSDGTADLSVTDSAAVLEAEQEGIIDESAITRLDEYATKNDVLEIIQKVTDGIYGKNSIRFLADMLGEYQNSHSEASRYWMAQTIFYSYYESYYVGTFGQEYRDPKTMINYAEKNFPDTVMPNASDIGVFLNDGHIGESWLCDICTDKDAIFGSEASTGIWREDYEDWIAPIFCCLAYDRTTGEKIMSLDDNGAFRPQEKVTVRDVAETAIRYKHFFEAPADDLPYTDVGSYDATIITDDLLNRDSQLPDSSCQSLPAEWHGVLWGPMEYVSNGALSCDTDPVATHGDIQILRDCGFNYLGFNLSFSYLQGPDFGDGQVNETRLKELDQIIAWCMEADIHIDIRCSQLQGYNNVDDFSQICEQMVEDYNDSAAMEQFAAFWGMLARRYAGISNRDISFTLLCEPEYSSDKTYAKMVKPAVEAIRAASPERTIVADIHSYGLKGTEIAKLGVALSYHLYDPREFCVLNGYENPSDDIIDNEEALHSVVWPYTTKSGSTYDSHTCMDTPMFGSKGNISLTDLINTAQKYNVGIIVGEFGVFGEHAGEISRYRYTDKTFFGYLSHMIAAFSEAGLPWCYGGFQGSCWCVALAYPAVEGVIYEKAPGSSYYVDTGFRDFLKTMDNLYYAD